MIRHALEAGINFFDTANLYSHGTSEESVSRRTWQFAKALHLQKQNNPVVAAPIVGALKTSHIDDAVKALSIKLSDDEAARLEAAYTPRIDVNVRNSDPKSIARMAATVGHEVVLPGGGK